jgi:hypothetical protein
MLMQLLIQKFVKINGSGYPVKVIFLQQAIIKFILLPMQQQLKLCV